MPGEFDFIEWIKREQKTSPSVLLGSGDDLAILQWPDEPVILIGVDQVLDGVHFDSTRHDPRSIGRKVMNRNLSDCAAMACLPAAAVATVALSVGTTLQHAQEFYRGLQDAARPFDCPIVGGDTASWPGKIAATVTILGRTGGLIPIRRDGARAGDGIFVTGPLGGSILGRHMTFPPRVQLARQLAAAWHISAMIDISDGLSRDLSHIARQSRVAAVLDAAAIPIHPDAAVDRADGRSPLEHALHDGEDYELLFTAARCGDPAACRIGSIIAGDAVFIEQDGRRQPLKPLGWEHAL
jgi:thiamine-monophosphate kinase